MTRFFMAILAVAAISCSVQAQGDHSKERGYPFITNYSARDMGMLTGQIWCVLEDDRGIMFFCTNDGIAEFDGSTWRTISMPTGRQVRSMAKDATGRVFVGGNGDLGYLDATPNGEPVLKSLLDQIPEENRDFTDVWETHIGSDCIYFTTDNYLFRWANDRFTVWPATESYHLSAFVHDQFYMRQWQIGLMKLEADSLVLVPGGERFALERIYVMLPYDESRMLMVTRTQGVLLYDGVTFERFPTEIDQDLLDGLIYLPGLELADGSFAFNTIYGGVLVMDRQGKRIMKLDKKSGLMTDTIYYVAQSSNGDLWLGSDDGVIQVEIGSPFSVFDERQGIDYQAYVVDRQGGALYAGNQAGVTRLDPETGRFATVSGISEQIFDLHPFEDELLAAGSQSGLFSITDGRTASVVVGADDGSYGAWNILATSWNENILFVGISDGLSAVERISPGNWKELGRVEFVGNARQISEERPGVLWVGIDTKGVFRVDYPMTDGRPRLDEAKLTYFGAEQGLQEDGVSPYRADGKMYFVSHNSIYRFESSDNRFIVDSTFFFDSFELGGSIEEQPSGEVWVGLGQKNAVATPQPDGSYSLDRATFRRLDYSVNQWTYPEPDGTAWFATLDGIIRYDPNDAAGDPQPVDALIRRVDLGADSMLFGGFGSPGDLRPKIASNHAEITFAFALPSYAASVQNRFETMLEGFDDGWSDWRAATTRSYTNLPAGDYRFHVRGRDVSGIKSGEAVYAFTVLPPWYQTWWAYLIYVIGAGSLVLGFVGVRTGQLKARQQELERKVEEQTAEVRELLVEADQRAAELGTVNEISRALVSQLEFDSLVQLVGEQIQKTFKADIVYVALLDDERKTINFPYGYGEEFPPIPFGKGLTSQIIDTGQPLLINEDVAGIHQKIGREEVGTSVASYLGVPIYEGKEVVGVVSVQSKLEEGRFDENDLRLMTTIASNVGIALQNAESYQKLNKTLQDLKSTQTQLVTQEKMASLGQLTAGIAHEIKNPLNFVNNFSDLNQELAVDLMSELEANRQRTIDDVYDDLNEIVMSMKTNAAQIAKHGKRADSIVKNMMLHAREGTTERFRVEVNAFVEEYIGLAYHGMRAQHPEMNVTIERSFDEHAGNAEMAPQEFGRVLLNLLNNAIYAVNELAQSDGRDYRPTVSISTRRSNGHLEVEITDNGPGMPDHVKEHIFEPLFTTKPAGSGTGLGLSLAFDIVTQMHGGQLTVDTVVGRGTTFVARIPT